MLNMHKQFEHKHTVGTSEGTTDLTIELGFTPSSIEVFNATTDIKTVFKTGMTVKKIDAAGAVTDDADGIVLHGGGSTFGYKEGLTPTYEDSAGTEVKDFSRIDPEGTKVLGAHLPKLSTSSDDGNKYISKPGFTIDADVFADDDVLFITASR